MTQLSAFGTLGNGATGPSASISFGGGILTGVMFTVTSPGYYLYGYRMWRSDSGQSASASFALWAMTSPTASAEQGTPARASTTTMATGQWNDTPLAAPVALTQNAVYMAASGQTGNFNDTGGQFGGSPGTYKAGIVNGALTVFSAPTAHGGTLEAFPGLNGYQGTFSTASANPATDQPLQDDSDSNFWIDVVVGPAPGTNASAGVAAVSALAHGATITTSNATSAPAGVAAVSAATAQSGRAVSAHAGVATVGASAAASSLTMKFSSTDGNGVQTWVSSTPMNSGGNHAVRIKPPASPPAGVPHSILYCLAVSVEGDASFGSALDILVTAGTPDTRNVTLVEPTWGNSPWYADHATDPTLRHESTMLALVNWVKANLATQPFAVQGTEAHHLLGFSKSGIGGLGLLFNWPTVFAKGAFWDWPADVTLYNRFDPDSTSAYGSQAAFAARYMPSSTFVSARKGPFTATISRQWHAGGVLYTGEVTDFDALLTAQSVPHQYASNNGDGTHHFDASWVLPGADAILPATGIPSAAVTAPKATAAVGARAGVASVASMGAPATVPQGVSAPAGVAAVASAAAQPRAAVTAGAGVASASGAAAAPRGASGASAAAAAVQAGSVASAAAIGVGAGAAQVLAAAPAIGLPGAVAAHAGVAAVGAGATVAPAAVAALAGAAQVQALAALAAPGRGAIAMAGVAAVAAQAQAPAPAVAAMAAAAVIAAQAANMPPLLTFGRSVASGRLTATATPGGQP